jgi:plastocyanin
MERRISGAALCGAALACLALSGCGGGPDKPAVEIGMGAVDFLPAEVEIRAGQTVEWLNGSGRDHDVASRGEEKFDSGQMAQGERFRRKFDRAGTFPYICSLHANQGMTGVVKVLPR